MTKNDALLPCQKETALENIESSMNLYDMPEHQDTIAVDGWALSELVDEVKRWRSTHSAGEFSPDYCAASEALAEHLEHCTRPTPAPLSKGDEKYVQALAAFKHAFKMAENLVDSSGTIAFYISAHKDAIQEALTEAATPSPVVDAKAVDENAEQYWTAIKLVSDMVTDLKTLLPDGKQWEADKRANEVMQVLANRAYALTAPKTDSKPVSGGVAEAIERIKQYELEGALTEPSKEDYRLAINAAQPHHPAEDSKPQEVSVTEFMEVAVCGFETARWLAEKYPKGLRIVKDKA